MGTAGERVNSDDAASVLARRVKAAGSKPAVVGFGISGPETAVAASRESDGVIVASALMRKILNGESTEQAASFVADMRQALDAAYPQG